MCFVKKQPEPRGERRGFQGKSVKSNPSSLSVIEACDDEQVEEGRESVA